MIDNYETPIGIVDVSKKKFTVIFNHQKIYRYGKKGIRNRKTIAY